MEGRTSAIVIATLLAVLAAGRQTMPIEYRQPETSGNGNQPPVADAGPDRTVMLADPVPFDASASNDPDRTGKWFVRLPLLTPRRNSAVAALGDELFVIGGEHRVPPFGLQFEPDDAVEVFRPESNEWRTVTSLPWAYGRGAAASIGSRILVVGGCDTRSALQRTDVYDPATGAWSSGPPPPYALCHDAGASRGSSLFALSHLAVLELGTTTDTWSARPHTSTCDTGGAAWALLGSRLFRMGGVDVAPSSCVSVLDLDSNVWTSGSPLLVPHGGNTGAAVMSGRVYIAGGDLFANDAGVTADLEEYDPATDTWTLKEPMPTARDEFGIGVAGEWLCVFGGSPKDWAFTYDRTECYTQRLAYVWDFGDGTTATGKQVEHAYTAPGVYTVSLCVTDQGGATGCDTALVTVLSPVLPADVDCDPDTLNRKSEGTWITCYVELPAGFDPRRIDAATVRLDGALPPELDPKYGFVKSESSYIVDHDGDGVEERLLKFARDAVIAMVVPGWHEFVLTGTLDDGTDFEGQDTIRVIEPP